MSNTQKSEIRPSEVRNLIEKVKQEKYGQYLKSVALTKARSFDGDRVQFDFPVTALIGPNGGGKSTILGAAACAYKSTIKPATFFPKSYIGDTSMADWQFEYEIIDKKASPKAPIRRISRFRKTKWVRDDILKRDVIYFGINRTVPAGERTFFKKLTKRAYKHKNAITAMSVEIIWQAERILGKSLKAFKVTPLSSGQDFYIGGDGMIQYSEFHFGAGEASVIRMVTSIEKAPNNSLVLIEEIENGLHPVAVRRMVEYLIDVADRKSLQAIFTTHSDAALEVLPPEAIWASIDGKVQHGKLSVEALRAISGRVDRRLAIFVEDRFAKDWIEAIIREALGNHIAEIGVYPLAGDGNAVKTHVSHNNNPAVKFKSICIIDGDSLQREDLAPGILRLPGANPESYIFDSIANSIDSEIAILTVSCQRAPERQSEVKAAIEEVSATNRDPHNLFNQVGIKIGFVPEEIVKGAFLAHWIRNNKAEVDRLIKPIKDALNSAAEKPGDSGSPS